VTFRDHFSRRAALYSTYRPSYPPELFEYLAGIAPARRLAWDCATGSGQAAVPLSRYFDRVIATDASAEQIAHSDPNEKVRYAVAAADASGLPPSSVDLVAVAQALHWFDLDEFFAEARRVLAPGGVLAVWGYGDPVIDDPELERISHAFNRGTLEKYWTANRDLLLSGYRSVPFPFREIETPRFRMTQRWTLPELAGYFRTWSATSLFVAEHCEDPVVSVEKELAAKWGGAKTTHLIEWPLYLRAGINSG
jgi:SAM-dependent methyltransferase